jgi:hypothetical protein
VRGRSLTWVIIRLASAHVLEELVLALEQAVGVRVVDVVVEVQLVAEQAPAFRGADAGDAGAAVNV